MIKGKVQKTFYLVSGPEIMGFADEVPSDKYPFQLNNMAAWLSTIMEWGNYPKAMKMAYMQHWRDIKYTVNGGKGRQRGRGSSLNTFTFEFGGWKIDLNIETKSHQQDYMERVRRGEHIRQRRAYISEPASYLNTLTGEIKAAVRQGDGRWHYEEFKDYSDFLARHPDANELGPRLKMHAGKWTG